jgi:sulfur-oxidizing protein SoxX
MLVLAQTAAAQDAARGAQLMFATEKGNCTICHAIPGLGLPDAAQGDIGPSLAGVGARWSQADLVAIITDPRRFMPDTIMPAFGVTEGLTGVAVAYRGRPILTGDEIADIAAYLAGLQ